MKTVFNNPPAHEAIDPYKILYNIGAMMDLPTGSYVRGVKGENILNGGFGALVAMVGRPNFFKSTIEHYMTLSAASRIAASGYAPYINTYDTEMNIHLDRLLIFSRRFKEFKDIDIIEAGIWKITDSTKHLGDEWYRILKDFLKSDKIKNKRQYIKDTPFIDKKGQVIKAMIPTFSEVDSLTKFVTADVEEISNKNAIGESGGNMIFARASLGKARLLMELPAVCNAASHYTIVTSHVSDISSMGATPNQPPQKKLQHMRQGEKIKGVPDDFLFLTNSLWQATNSTVLMNAARTGPEFPRTRETQEESPADLNKVTLKLLRNKSGPSGYVMDILVSQIEGVLPTLSEFFFIKENGRFGLEGSNTNYHLALLPEVSLQRTTVRENIDNNEKLRRAIKITADILQIKQLYPSLPFEIPDLKVLREKLDKQYGWDLLLNTRDFWTFDQYENAVPFLSSMDILEMYYDLYVPYFLRDKKGK